MSARITAIIEKNGDVRFLNAIGLGMGCQQATADIEKALGIIDENSRALTDNYYQEVDPLILKQNTE